MDDRRKSEAIAAARREIARRIARFCTTLSPEEFDRWIGWLMSSGSTRFFPTSLSPRKPGGETREMTD